MGKASIALCFFSVKNFVFWFVEFCWCAVSLILIILENFRRRFGSSTKNVCNSQNNLNHFFPPILCWISICFFLVALTVLVNWQLFTFSGLSNSFLKCNYTFYKSVYKVRRVYITQKINCVYQKKLNPFVFLT